MLQRDPVQILHGDKRLAVLFANVVEGANVGVIQSGCGLGFALEAGQGLGVAGNFLRQKLECYKTVKPRVFGFVDHAHTATAQPFDDAVVRNSLPDHWQAMLRGRNGVSQSGRETGRGIRYATTIVRSAPSQLRWGESFEFHRMHPPGLWRTWKLSFAGVEFSATGELPEGPFTALGCAWSGTQ